MKFDLANSLIYQALVLDKTSVFKLSKFLWKVFGILFIIFFLTSVGFFVFVQDSGVGSRLVGLALICFALFLIFLDLDLFFELRLKYPKLEHSIAEALNYNVAEFLTLESARAIEKALSSARFRRPPYVNSSLLLYYLLELNPNLGFVFYRANLDFEGIKKFLQRKYFERKSAFSFPFWRGEEVAWTRDLEQTILEAIAQAQKKRHVRITPGDLLSAMARTNLDFREFMREAELTQQDIENLVWWLEYMEEKIRFSRRFWEKKNLAKYIPLAKEWSAGYTVTLDRYSTDLTELVVKNRFEEVIGRDKEIAQIERILEREEINNVLLIGEAGSGRKAIVRGLARKIMLGESSDILNYRRVVDLDMVSLFAATQSTEEVEEILHKIFQECVNAGNVILVIREFHNYVGGLVGPGAMDISGVLSDYLHLPQFQLIGVTTYTGLHNYIEQNPSIASLFGRVEIGELPKNDLIRLIENVAISYESKYKRFVTYPAIREIITLAERYIHDVPFPRKALNLLDEVMVYVSRHTKQSFVLPQHVRKVVSEITEIPVGKVEVKEKEVLLNLENLLHQRIIDQNEAVNEVSAALRRARAGVETRRGPMGSFLFLGPTGVGKTETSKALAELYFGSENRMIRLDMSEFQTLADIPRLLGSSGTEGLLTTPIRENPFSLLLLDELEKAHPNILNLFLQVLDEGWITDGTGRKVDFTNTIIIATSNAGYQIILKALESGESWESVKKKLLDFLFQQGIFRPEFINRFDGVVLFKPLSRENIIDIAGLQLKKIKDKLKQDKGIEFLVTQKLKEKIANLGYNPIFGAREMRRVIQEYVENSLAQAILEEKIKRGDRIMINPEDFSVQKLSSPPIPPSV